MSVFAALRREKLGIAGEKAMKPEMERKRPARMKRQERKAIVNSGIFRYNSSYKSIAAEKETGP